MRKHLNRVPFGALFVIGPVLALACRDDEPVRTLQARPEASSGASANDRAGRAGRAGEDSGAAAGRPGPATNGGSSAGRSTAGAGGSTANSGGNAGEAAGAGDGPNQGGEGGERSTGVGTAGTAGGGGAEEAGAAGDGAAGSETAGSAGAGGCGELSTGGRIRIDFDLVDPERVTHLEWIDGRAASTGNLIGEGGPLVCGDPLEYFGQAYGSPEGATLAPVASGHRGTVVACGPDRTIVSSAADCLAAPQIPVTTEYHFYTGLKANQVRITRSFGFDAGTPLSTSVGLRAFVARVSLTTFPSVVYPNLDETALTSARPGDCTFDCTTPAGAAWSGRWFANLDPASGRALIVLRDPSLSSPVSLVVNNDGYSWSNLTSFVMMQPSAGWKEPLTEIEYLCFADLDSWPQSERDAARLPADCGP